MESSQSFRQRVNHADPLPAAFERLLQFLTTPGKGCLERFGLVLWLCEERCLFFIHRLQAVAESRQRGFVCASMLNQGASRRFTRKGSGSATLTAQFAQLVVPCRACIDHVENAHFFLLAQTARHVARPGRA